ncbi:Gamma-glutamyl:cysteine ligase YbdK, ATP-grasp superfamily [Nonomuraea solani]|uniref:Gamma-glutamyl:cysteine ligase YbdK, ATP-grasp superfamily n=1 Tax=Nonomuraea solani TaxID=1144553 RepID=A0A1H5YJF7_9ACTN|nr:glutamate--cysteine ligase [Nonomuraea solani]SEG23667.1 Gamma-glutamyl:cysteine ligase YbdK, ATP-grasp superfamily [Nonomuraea solani]
MGRDLDKERFTEAEFARFGERAKEQLAVLRELLDTPGFGQGPITIGAELELFLIDEEGRPLPRNSEVQEALDDPRVVLELGRYNIEVNLTPTPLAGTPFEVLSGEVQETVSAVDRAVEGGGAVPIGILPTLDTEDFTVGAISDQNRYRAMSRGIRRLRLEPFLVKIDDLELSVEDVILESANTSWQVHMRTPPDRFARLFNAAQLATGPVLAACGNSPFFLGRELWEETRIALMEEAADDRDVQRRERRDGRVTFGSDWVYEGAHELFERYVNDYDPILPDLTEGAERHEVPELRLHQGTIWQWNRPVYDPADGGHLRIELRALPAGPSCADMAANTAFLLGLTLSQAERDLTGYRFAEAYQNFYRAAMHGLDAKLSWPGRDGEFEAADLVLSLLPEARAGLLGAGVAVHDADRALGVMEQRVRLRRTGSVWQREALARFGGDRRRLVRRYRELALSGLPVHLWD